MKRLSMAILVLFVSFTNLFPQTYYVSSSSGSDNNNGLSESSPWKSIKKVNSKTFKPGDNILFKKGDIWIGEQLVIDKSGNAGNTITYSAYGIGAKPIITTRDSINGAMNGSNWTAVSGLTNVWSIPLVSDKYFDRLWLSGSEAKLASYYKFQPDQWMEYLQKGDNGDGTYGVCPEHPFYHNKTILYVYAASNPATVYSSFEIPAPVISGAYVRETVLIKDADYITIDGLDVQGGGYASL